LHAAGQLRPVVVPEIEWVALRDLVRAREDLRRDLMGARHRISKPLLRHGHVFEQPGETWSTPHLRWLSKVCFAEALTETVFGKYLAHQEILLARRDRLGLRLTSRGRVDRGSTEKKDKPCRPGPAAPAGCHQAPVACAHRRRGHRGLGSPPSVRRPRAR
jgi:hypothetical protein